MISLISSWLTISSSPSKFLVGGRRHSNANEELQKKSSAACTRRSQSMVVSAIRRAVPSPSVGRMSTIPSVEPAQRGLQWTRAGPKTIKETARVGSETRVIKKEWGPPVIGVTTLHWHRHIMRIKETQAHFHKQFLKVQKHPVRILWCRKISGSTTIQWPQKNLQHPLRHKQRCRILLMVLRPSCKRETSTWLNPETRKLTCGTCWLCNSLCKIKRLIRLCNCSTLVRKTIWDDFMTGK